MGRIRDLTNQKYNRLTAISKCGTNKHGQVIWNCKCDCGKEVQVVGYALTSNNTKSCGCWLTDEMVERNTTHGMRFTRIYRIWKGVKSRCTIPSATGYEYYGARGINICDRWMSFEMFFEDVGKSYEEHVISHGEKGTTLDRVNTDGDYEPLNYRWATMSEQAYNKRKKAS